MQSVGLPNSELGRRPKPRAPTYIPPTNAVDATQSPPQADPNPVVLAVKAAFDLNKASVYVNK